MLWVMRNGKLTAFIEDVPYAFLTNKMKLARNVHFLF